MTPRPPIPPIPPPLGRGHTHHGAALVARSSFGTVLLVSAALIPAMLSVGAPLVVYVPLLLGMAGAATSYALWNRGFYDLATALHSAGLIGAGLLALLGSGTVGGATSVLFLASVITAGGLRGLRAAVLDVLAVFAAVALGFALGPWWRVTAGLPPAGWIPDETLLLVFLLGSLPSWGIYVVAVDWSNRIAWQRSESGAASLARALEDKQEAHRQLALAHEAQAELARIGVLASSTLEPGVVEAALAQSREGRFAGTSAEADFDLGAQRILSARAARQELLEERAALARELQRKERSAALERLSGGTAHDINNALTSVIGAAERIRLDPALPPHLQRYADRVVQSGLHAARVVATLGSYARGLPAEATTTTDMGEVLRETQPLYEACCGDEAELELEVTSIEARVQVSRDLLERAVLNLVRNAVRATSAGERGRVAIRAWVERGAATRMAHIEVSDRGAGMDAETLAHATEPYFSGSQGTGLGLTLVQGLANQVGGALEISSKVGSGTQVRLSLPLADAPASVDRVTPAGDVRTHLLLIDDDPDVREAVADMCESLGYRTSQVGDGEAASRVAAADPPDLIVCDVRLADESGYTLVARLRADGLDRPTLFITGFAGRDTPESPSGDPVLVKPFRRESLARALRVMAPPRPPVDVVPAAAQRT